MVGGKLARAACAATFGLMLTVPGAAAYASCSDWHPVGEKVADQPRHITARDLIEVVNIGRGDGEVPDGSSPIAISPDRGFAAVVLQRADIKSNSYCQALVLIDLTGAREPTVLDRGGDFQIEQGIFRDLYVTIGASKEIIPDWSPDGRSIAYLRRDNGTTQLWVAMADQGGARQLTQEPVDVTDWAWLDSGHIVYATHPKLLELRRDREEEGHSGWHYDRRVTPNVGPWPQTPGPLPDSFQVFDVADGGSRPASAAEAAMIAERKAAMAARSASSDGMRAWLSPISESIVAPLRVHAANGDGTEFTCLSAACSGKIQGIWWEQSRHQIVFLRHEGWNNRYSTVYSWTPGAGAPQRLIRTDDVIGRCTIGSSSLLCVGEAAQRPPHVIAIDLGTGATSTVFDPNAGYEQLELGSVHRLTWRNDHGLKTYGDLILPPDYKPGTHLPLIVTLYQSRGFLRGGTGNEYPIYLFAERGFAVLSIDTPPTVASQLPGIRTNEDFGTANLKDWAERRSVESSIETGVKMLISRGIVDPDRIGITGLSAGASSVRFALLNSDLFAAASISSCCVDEYSDIMVGPAWTAFSQRIGYPPALPIDREFWKPYSLALNAETMNTPLLMQLADGEYLYALPTITALNAYNKPVDMYVFPGEFHIKWQPAHRLAIYERNLDWFSFWLQGGRHFVATDRSEARRWEAMFKAMHLIPEGD